MDPLAQSEPLIVSTATAVDVLMQVRESLSAKVVAGSSAV